jgi:hypothetical protein
MKMIRSVEHYASLTVYFAVGVQYGKPSTRFLRRKGLYSGAWLLKKVEWMGYNEYFIVDIFPNLLRKIEEVDRG